MEEQGMVTEYYKRVSADAKLMLGADENKAMKQLGEVTTDFEVKYYNNKMTILVVEATYENETKLRLGNTLMCTAGFSTSLETMLTKDN